MNRILRVAGHTSPNRTTVERICYRGHLVKESTALSMLRAFTKFAEQEGRAVNEALLSGNSALTEFGWRVVNLWGTIAAKSGQSINAQTNLIGNIASIANLTPEAIIEAGRGKCVLIPESVANDISRAAQEVLKLPQPLKVERRPINDTSFKPIGANGAENGAAAFKCSNTAKIRLAILSRLRAPSL